MIASSAVARRKYSFYKWPELENPEASKPRRQRMTHWFTKLKNETAPLCHKCRNRRLDLRPLTAKPPAFSELPEDPENEDLNELEERYAVFINDFSPEESKTTRLECSLCALLLCCLFETEQQGWLGYMSCECTLRPRFDRSTNGKRGRIIHKQQIWVEFQPIEGEVLLDLVDVDETKPNRKRRKLIPAIADLKLLRYWLKDCDEKHSHPDIPDAIRSRMQTILHSRIFRVINTSTGLVEVPDSLPIFAALSYVWGPNSSQPKNRPLEGGPISDYPPTIRDSIIVAQSLGYKWLWIDRVCIDQTSDSEKANLIPYMKDIYATAHLTIVAACGNGAQSGLLGTQSTPRKAENPLIIGSSVAVHPVCLRFEKIISDSIWSKRGWTFQEHVFSRRQLFVSDSEMFFKCAEYTFRESRGRLAVVNNQGDVNRWLFHESRVCDAAGLQAMLHGKIAKTERLLTLQRFLKAVMAYSERSLSVKEDRMDAFAGVILASMNPMDHASEQAFLKHGHPLPFFESLLTWRRGYFGDAPEKLPVPSWSWAYTGTGVDIPMSSPAYNGNRYCWFQYSHIRNYDVLGLPTKMNAMAYLVDLPLSDELVADQSWIESLPGELNSDHKGGESAIAPALTSPPPPKLHLLTLVFDARLVRCDPYSPDKYALLPLDSTGSPMEVLRGADGFRPDVMSKWSIQPGYEHFFPREGTSPRQQPFETFAIITGHLYPVRLRDHKIHNTYYFKLHVMLLEATTQKDTYSRLGINDVLHVRKGSYVVDTIKRGRPRWQYIHII